MDRQREWNEWTAFRKSVEYEMCRLLSNIADMENRHLALSCMPTSVEFGGEDTLAVLRKTRAATMRKVRRLSNMLETINEKLLSLA